MFRIFDEIRVELYKTKKWFNKAPRIADLGSWELNLQSKTMYSSEGLFRIFEIDSQPNDLSYKAFLNIIHPDERSRINDIYTQHFLEHNSYDIVYRLLMSDGRIKYVQEQCESFYADDGILILSSAIVQDITKQKVLEQMLEERETQYHTLIAHASDAILLVDRQGNLIEGNQKAEELLGYSREELTALHISQLHPPEVLEALYKNFNDILVYNQGKVFETLVLRKDGSLVPVEITGSCIKFNGRHIAQGIFRDISERKQSQKVLQESQQFLQTVLDTFPLSIFWKDRNSVYLGCNYHFLKDTGLTSGADVIGKTDYDMPWGNTEADAYRDDDKQVINSKTPKLGIIETQLQANGEIIWLETNKLPLYSLDGNVIGVLGTYQDITKRKQAEIILLDYNQKLKNDVQQRTRELEQKIAEREQAEIALKEAEANLRKANLELSQLVNIDGLTKIANRRCFDERLEQEWYRLYRSQQPLSLILFDIDYFKRYNDYYGHQMGDECLVKIAQTVQDVVHRSTDLFARYGGEEFAIILPNTALKGASIVAQKIHAAIKNDSIPHNTSAVNDVVTISLGISSMIPTAESSPAILISQADQALYLAKQQGRNQSVVFKSTV